MSAPTWELLVGPFAALVLSLVILYATFRLGLIIPGPIYESEKTRNAALEREAEIQNERLIEQRVANAKLEGEVSHLTEEVRRLRGEISALTTEISRLRKSV